MKTSLRSLLTAEAWEQLRQKAQAYGLEECQTLVQQTVGSSPGPSDDLWGTTAAF